MRCEVNSKLHLRTQAAESGGIPQELLGKDCTGAAQPVWREKDYVSLPI